MAVLEKLQKWGIDRPVIPVMETPYTTTTTSTTTTSTTTT